MNFKYSALALIAVFALVSFSVATNGRQMKGYITSPLPATVIFDIPETTGIGACIYLGAAGASSQTGGLYMRIAECNDTSLTALIADGCGSFGQTFPISNTSYTVGVQLDGAMDVSQRFNGVAYTEYHIECYNPTPAEVLPPAPGAVPPSVPTPITVPIRGVEPSLNPNSASAAAPAFVALIALVCALAALL